MAKKTYENLAEFTDYVKRSIPLNGIGTKTRSKLINFLAPSIVGLDRIKIAQTQHVSPNYVEKLQHRFTELLGREYEKVPDNVRAEAEGRTW